MNAILHCDGIVLPLDRPNVDTDQIIPARFLTSISRSGFGPNLFFGWRYLADHGSIARPNLDFVLNQPRYANAPFLLARRNFGCGSSREHAVWALQQQGFSTVIAPSFGDIFQQNSLRNGLLTVTLDEASVDRLFKESTNLEPLSLSLDLERQILCAPSVGLIYHFDIDPFRKECLLRGLDEVGITLAEADAIRAFEALHFKTYPWLVSPVEMTQ